MGAANPPDGLPMIRRQKVHALLALLAGVKLNREPPRRSPWEWFPLEGIHLSSAHCPLWYDGCWCTYHVRRGQKRKARGRHPLGGEASRFRWLRQHPHYLTLQQAARRCHLTVEQVMGLEDGRLGYDARGWELLFDRLHPPF